MSPLLATLFNRAMTAAYYSSHCIHPVFTLILPWERQHNFISLDSLLTFLKKFYSKIIISAQEMATLDYSHNLAE